MQSTNEELETSKEELQSVNEEMGTLNNELSHKNAELHAVNNDLSNFLNSAKIPIVMLDSDLRIRRLTPSADVLVKAVSSDVGRSIADIRLNVNVPDLEGMIAKVVDDLQPVQRDVQDPRGCWHSLHILPYRTLDNKIDGVVLVLQDIDAIKAASEQLRKSSDFFRIVLDTVRVPLLVLDAELRVLSANKPFLSAFQVSRKDTVNSFIYDLGNGQWNISKLRELLERVLSKKKAVTDFEVEHDFESIGQKTMVLNAEMIVLADNAQPMLLLSIDDITESKLAGEKLRVSEERFRMIADNMSQLAWTCDQLGNVTWYNQRWLDYTGMASEEMEGWDWSKVQHPDHLDRVVRGVERSRDTGEAWEDIFPLRDKDGKYRWFLSRAVPILDADRKVVRWFGTNTDITERQLAEAALIKSEKLAAAGRLAATLAHEINNPLQAVTNLLSLLAQSPRLDAQDQTYATMAADELERVTHLTRQSLSFYRDATFPTAVNVEEVVENVFSLYTRRLAARKISVSKRFRLEGTIQSYPGEIRQVLSTLLVNAMEAVQDGGRIVLHVTRSSNTRKNPAVRGIQITLADNGSGIPFKDCERIFDPFFTTKGEQGTGLGLWVARTIVHRLGGSIGVRSSVREGKCGTCFSIFLPDEISGA